MSDIPQLSIAIVSWNVREYVRRCLLSLKKYLAQSYEVILVDNASNDGTADMVRQEFPWVKLIVNERNVGFASGTNQALREARGEWLVLLNDDTELTDDAFSPLIDFARQQHNLGAIGPELLNADLTHQMSVRRFPHLLDQILVLLKLPHIFPRLSPIKKYMADPGQGVRTPIEVDQIMGACMIIPRAALTEVGYLDDGYPNWFEEVDWCYRAKQAGRRIIYAPLAQVIHHRGKSFNQVLSVAKHRWMLIGLNRYARKFWPRWQSMIIWLVSGVSYLLTIIQTIFKPR